ncbi:MAG: hypothetical protein IJ538_03420 [Clostridia bacterium]|nr:hypothetical protein [Clostridia bacterium]
MRLSAYQIIKLDNLKKDSDELEGLLNRIEVAGDPKLSSFYRAQLKEISEVVLCYEKFLQATATEKEIFETQLLNYCANEGISGNQCAEITISGKDKKFCLEFKQFIFNYAQKNQLNTKELNEKQVQVSGFGAFEKLKFLSGVVRKILKGSRSDLTVTVYEILADEFTFNENDLKFEISKSSGAGGQHINKTESAVKVVHVPTGISVKVQDNRSQFQNKERAIELLKQKLFDEYKKNSEKYIKNQQKQLKNAIFSDTATVVFDFDRNVFKTISGCEIKLKLALDGDFVLSGNGK